MGDRFITVDGLCLPNGQAEKCGGRVEFVDSSAIKSIVDRSADVFLNFDHHDAPAICRPVTLFASAAGLCFRASIAAAHWDAIRPWVLTSHQFCSVNIVDETIERERLADGTPAVRIVDAKIDHITIADQRAVYQGTGCWPSEVVGTMPPRLARLRAQWDQGFQTWKARKDIARMRSQIDALAASRENRRRSSSASNASRLAARLASFQPAFAATRARWAAGVAGGLIPCGAMMGSAAFSKAADFDGDFRALLQSARPRLRRL